MLTLMCTGVVLTPHLFITIMIKIKAILRLLLFEMPCMFISGLVYILFDNYEIVGVDLRMRKQWRPNIKRRIITSYLNDCYKLVHKKERANDEKRLD